MPSLFLMDYSMYFSLRRIPSSTFLVSAAAQKEYKEVDANIVNDNAKPQHYRT